MYLIILHLVAIQSYNILFNNRATCKITDQQMGKLIMTPDESFFERDRAGSSIFGQQPRYVFVFIKISTLMMWYIDAIIEV